MSQATRAARTVNRALPHTANPGVTLALETAKREARALAKKKWYPRWNQQCSALCAGTGERLYGAFAGFTSLTSEARALLKYWHANDCERHWVYVRGETLRPSRKRPA